MHDCSCSQRWQQPMTQTSLQHVSARCHIAGTLHLTLHVTHEHLLLQVLLERHCAQSSN